MNDINQIDINVDGIIKPINMTIKPKELKAYSSLGEKEISSDFVPKLLRIVCLWKNDNSSIIDGPSYLVRITTSKEVVDYNGKGSLPYNFKEFLDLIGKLYG